MPSDMQALVLSVAGIVSALGVIGGAIFWLGRKVGKVLNTLQDDRKEATYCRKWTLRQAIVNPAFPDSERLEAYERYREMGGNGYMAEYAEALKERMGSKITAKIEGEEAA